MMKDVYYLFSNSDSNSEHIGKYVGPCTKAGSWCNPSVAGAIKTLENMKGSVGVWFVTGGKEWYLSKNRV